MTAPLFPDLIVNGETVPYAFVAAETQNHDAPAGKPGIAWRKAANAVAIRTLLLQEARARKIQPDPIEVRPGQFETDDEASIRDLLECVVDVEKPKEKEVHSEWKKDPERFRAPPLWEVSHILIACDPRDKDASEKAKRRADMILRRVNEDPKSFACLSSKESDCDSRLSGGALGQLRPGDTVPEFETVLRGLAEGHVTPGPVLSRHGWHIIRMDAVAKGNVLPFETAQSKISDAMEKVNWAKAARAYVDSLVSKADIQGAGF